MVKTYTKKEESIVVDFYDVWMQNYTSTLKIWEDSFDRLYKPWLRTTNEIFEKAVNLSAESSPIKYKEFYDEWERKCHDTPFGKFYNTPAISSSRENLEKFISSADNSNKLYKSWIDELEKNSRMTRDLLKGDPEPEKYKECYDVWMKSYEKMFYKIMALPSQENMKEILGNYMIFPDIYLEGYLQMTKLWKDSYSKIYGPVNESMLKLSEKIAEISKGNASPGTYKDFYTLYMNTYKDLCSRYTSMEPSRDMLEKFKESTDVYLSVYKSWISALDAMSEQAEELLKQNTDPKAFREFQHFWMKTYEKGFESFFKDMPVMGPMKEIMEPMKIMARMYIDMFTELSKVCFEPGIHSASSYPGKHKKIK